MRYLKGFFAFWYDFIVGDAWEVAVGVGTSLVISLRRGRTEAIRVGVPAADLIAILLGYSIWRVRDRR